jgi:hypothetical protein
VFDEIINEEVNYSCNQLGSAVIEKLLPAANDTVLKRLMKAFEEKLRPICCDPYGSYVLQKLLVTVSERGLVSVCSYEVSVGKLVSVLVNLFNG